MPWPLSQDYNEAIQTPVGSFGDAELRGGQPVTNALGLPMPRSGAFADVYEFVGASGRKWAIKCFTREKANLQSRYHEISKHLRLAKLPFSVDFAYLPQGIRVHGQRYPALKMQWVEGFLLNEFVSHNLDKPAVLEALSQIWLRMACRLREAGVTHADLQHGNVILVPGSQVSSLAVKLIDYDGMFLPSVAGMKSEEVGHANYQHPQRLREETYSAEVDRFPNLVIYTALRALVVGGQELWKKYDNGDNLLFKQSDLADPAHSPLFHELMQITHPEIRRLVQGLARAAQQPLEQTPLLEKLVGSSPTRKKQVQNAAPQAAPESIPPALPASDLEFTSPSETSQGASRINWEPEPSKKSWLLLGGIAAVFLVFVGSLLFLTGQDSERRSPDVAKVDQPSSSPHLPDRGKGLFDNKVPDQAIPKSDGDSRPVTKESLKPDPKIDLVSPKSAEPPQKQEPLKKSNPKPRFPQSPLTPPRPEPSPPQPMWENKEVLTLTGHTGYVNSVAFSPDGKQIASGGSVPRTPPNQPKGIEGTTQHVFRLWDVATGKETAKLEGQTGNVHSVAFSPDGTFLASGSTDKTVRLWDSETGREIHVLTEHTGNVNSVSFSPDGKYLASGSTDKTVRLWDSETGREIHVLTGHTTSIWSVAFSPDGTYLASASSDKTVRLWDTSAGTEIRVLARHTAIVRSVAFSPDGKYLASASSDKTVRLWDTSAGREIRVLTGHTGTVWSVAFSPDGKHLASGSTDQTVRLWDTATGMEIRVLAGHTSTVTSVSFSPDGKHLASGSYDQTVKIWNVAPANLLAGPPPQNPEVPLVKPGPVLPPALPNVAGREVLTLTGYTGAVRSVAFSPDGKQIVSGGNVLRTTPNQPKGIEGIRLWDVATGKETAKLEGQTTGPVHSVAFSPDGKSLVSGSNDKTVRLWDTSTGREIRVLTGHTTSIWSVAFSPDGKYLASGSGRYSASGSIDMTVRLWDTLAGTEIRVLTGHTSTVRSVAFSPDGKYLASGSDDKTVRLWDSETGREIGVLTGHTGRVNSVAFSPDGKYLASGSSDKTVRLWDPSTGTEIRVLTGHTTSIWSVAFSPDGKHLASGSTDQTVRLWDPSTGRETGVLTGHTGRVNSVAFSPDGKYLASGSDDQTVKIWNVAPENMVAEPQKAEQPLLKPDSIQPPARTEPLPPLPQPQLERAQPLQPVPSPSSAPEPATQPSPSSPVPPPPVEVKIPDTDLKIYGTIEEVSSGKIVIKRARLGPYTAKIIPETLVLVNGKLAAVADLVTGQEVKVGCDRSGRALVIEVIVPVEGAKAPADAGQQLPAALALHINKLQSENPAERVQAANDLAKMGRPALPAVRALCAAATDDSRDVRQAAIEAIELIYPTLAKPVTTLIVDPDNFSSAARELREMGEWAAPAIPVFRWNLKNSKRSATWTTCIQTL